MLKSVTQKIGWYRPGQGGKIRWLRAPLVGSRIGRFLSIDSIRSVQSVKVELKSIIIIDKTREDAPNRRQFFNVPENRQVQSQRNIKNWNISHKLNKRSKDGLQYSRISNHLAGTVSLIGQGSRPSLFAYPLPRSKLSFRSLSPP